MYKNYNYDFLKSECCCKYMYTDNGCNMQFLIQATFPQAYKYTKAYINLHQA